MTGSRLLSLVVTTAIAASLVCLPAEAATVRRHLHCATVSGGVTIQILIPTTLPGVASITNNWNFPIPAGAAFTLTVAGKHPVNFTLAQDIAPGASFGAGHPDITGPGLPCDASYLDTGYQSGGGTTPPKTSKFGKFAVPKQGMFSTN